MNHRYGKISGFTGILCVFLLIFLSMQPVKAQTTGINVKAGDTMSYSGSSSASYRNYGGGIDILITDASTYPVKGNLTLKNCIVDADGKCVYWSDYKNPVSEGGLIPYILKIPTVWANGSQYSPFLGYVASDSILVTNWTGEHLLFNVSAIYADSERDTIVMSYSYDYLSQGDRYNAVGMYRWDMEFGVLLQYHINITNYDDFTLDGFIALSLGSTNLWKLETGGIPGYPIESIGFFAGITIACLYIISKKRKSVGGK